MTTAELIQKLRSYPPEAHVVCAVDWSEVGIDDSYLAIAPKDGGPCIAFEPTGWAASAKTVVVGEATFAPDSGGGLTLH